MSNIKFIWNNAIITLSVLFSPVASVAQTVDGVLNNDGISNNEAHQKCLAAVDYEGCIRVQRGLVKNCDC